MIDVALCIAREHDPWLVLLAVFVCCTGGFAIIQMLGRAQATRGAERIGWLFLTATGAGATIWCTHFVAMLAYQAGVPVTLDPVLTIVSLIVAVLGTGMGFGVAVWRRGVAGSMLGGAIVGLAISMMHFTGMEAYRVDGIVAWRTPYVVASVLSAVVFAGLALGALHWERLGRWRVAAGTGLLVVAIAALHFVAMTALKIIPLHLDSTPLDPQQMQALGLATALVGLVVIAAGISAAFIDRSTRKDASQRLDHMARNDALTGLPNRAAFLTELTHQIELARASGCRVGIVAVNVDRFKVINDVHGHRAGDAVLATLAQRLRGQMRRHELVARFGGDEFVAMIRFDNDAELHGFAHRIESTLEAPLMIGTTHARVAASIGAASFPQDAEDAEALTNNAHLAMHRAKDTGVSAACFYDAPIDEAIRERRELTADLRRAIDADQLHIHYQVQALASTGEVSGYEALVRWTHPQHGPIAPDIFIPIAEQSGLIHALGEWVMRRACTDAMGWEHPWKVAVNVSPAQLSHAGLPTLFHQIMLDTGMPPRRLEVELTETAIMTNRDQALHILRQIKALGVGVALDDFGTGYSSLETLRAFPFDKIKLDRLFVSELDSPQAIAIIRAVLTLGRSLHIPVLAEGIETERQLFVLRREGCDEVQGYLIGHPGLNPLPLVDTADPAVGKVA